VTGIGAAAGGPFQCLAWTRIRESRRSLRASA